MSFYGNLQLYFKFTEKVHAATQWGLSFGVLLGTCSPKSMQIDKKAQDVSRSSGSVEALFESQCSLLVDLDDVKPDAWQAYLPKKTLSSCSKKFGWHQRQQSYSCLKYARFQAVRSCSAA